MMTTFFPSTVYVGLPHLRSSFIAKPASTRRIAAISAFHLSRYAISMQSPSWHGGERRGVRASAIPNGYATRMTKPTAELWIKVNLPGIGQIGPGKINLLRQIRTQESISGAARAMKMSYRRAWLLVDELNKLFAKPLVATWAGGKSRGGASLTKLGEQLIENYDTVVERAMRANQAVLSEIARSVNGGADAEH
jgi:molybdate transport system regulatory protein